MCSISHNSTPAGIGDIGGPAISSQPLISVRRIDIFASVAVHLEGYSLVLITYEDHTEYREDFIAMVSAMSMHRDVRICCCCYFFISAVSSY